MDSWSAIGIDLSVELHATVDHARANDFGFVAIWGAGVEKAQESERMINAAR